MRRMASIFVWLVFLGAASLAIVDQRARAQSVRVVDRIVARIEGDIILLSQVRELGSFQKLVEGRADSDERLLAELIDQWIVQTEATESRFPQPAQTEVDRQLALLTAQFASPVTYAGKVREQGLSTGQVRELLSRQIYVEQYIDYKFRPAAQIKSEDVENYFQKELLPELAKKNRPESGGPTPQPSIAEVEVAIREVLTQRAITDLSTKWLDDTRSRLKIEETPPGAKS